MGCAKLNRNRKTDLQKVRELAIRMSGLYENELVIYQKNGLYEIGTLEEAKEAGCEDTIREYINP